MEGKNVVTMNAPKMQGINISEMYTNGFENAVTNSTLSKNRKQIKSVQLNQTN